MADFFWRYGSTKVINLFVFTDIFSHGFIYCKWAVNKEGVQSSVYIILRRIFAAVHEKFLSNNQQPCQHQSLPKVKGSSVTHRPPRPNRIYLGRKNPEFSRGELISLS